MSLKHRIASFGFLLIFLSAWLPSSIAHTFDPHHGNEYSSQTLLHESDHCPYCDIQLTDYSPAHILFFSVTVEVKIISPVSCIHSVSGKELFSVPSRGPPAC